MTRTTITQADLTRNPQEVVERVQHGMVAVVEKGGREQIVLLDPLDFRLLHALSQCALMKTEREVEEPTDPAVAILEAYLAEEISLGKAAELLGLHRLEFQRRCQRLGIPLRLGPASLEEAEKEVFAALKAG